MGGGDRKRGQPGAAGRHSIESCGDRKRGGAGRSGSAPV
ncbi:hypothetical protein OCO_03320 [Mycobacterium intracellulare MOTT-02]|nr:hypothetical protein OCO_03320 [Mycobacterium intracellulare MOTT-02]